MLGTDHCMLQHAVGRQERCPGERCPFWERDHCALAGIGPDIETNPELAHHLLAVRSRLAKGEGWDIFRMLPAGPPPDATEARDPGRP